MATFIDPKTVPQRKLYTGEYIPGIGMGTFGSDRFTPEQVSAAVGGAIEAGYRLFDCAAVYGNEDLIGEVFKAAFDKGTVKREELFITTKVWNDMHGNGDVLLSCAKSLKDLKLDCIDLFFVHWPFPNYHAPGCDGDSRNPDHSLAAVKFCRDYQQNHFTLTGSCGSRSDRDDKGRFLGGRFKDQRISCDRRLFMGSRNRIGVRSGQWPLQVD